MKTALLAATLVIATIGCSEDPPYSLIETVLEDQDVEDDGWDSLSEDPDDALDTETDDALQTVDPAACPWICQPQGGPNVCDNLYKNWVHNPNFACDSESHICCQPPEGPLKKNCAQQRGHYCGKKCKGQHVLNSNLYCPNANSVCCEDPAGPVPFCAEAGGECVPFLERCPNGMFNSDIDCSTGNKCCLPPNCPWTCERMDGKETCSDLPDPTRIRNRKFSCPDKGGAQACCQPIDSPKGLKERCDDQPQMACQESCGRVKQKESGFYCDSAKAVCCLDLRSPCEELGGTCGKSILGNCRPGWMEEEMGSCKKGLGAPKCCIKVADDNECVRQGDTCVSPKLGCPPIHIPKPFYSCGKGSRKTCCSPIINL